MVDPAAAASLRLCAAETRSRFGEFLISIKADVVDARFAGLNTIHYLLKVLVFDLQSVSNQ
jgi:ABC-type branched-subunit amino acid transport system permease subunit